MEGANILTRSLIIFGQGILRCHPYLQQEMKALNDANRQRGIVEFDKSFSAHVQFFLANTARLLFHSLTFGFFCQSYPIPHLKKKDSTINTHVNCPCVYF